MKTVLNGERRTTRFRRNIESEEEGKGESE